MWLRSARRPSMPARPSVTPEMNEAFEPSWSGTETYQPLLSEETMSSATVDWRKLVALDPPPFSRE